MAEMAPHPPSLPCIAPRNHGRKGRGIQPAIARDMTNTMSSRVEIVTPEQAAQILANQNPNNRPVSRERVRRYAEEMTQHRWALSPQGLSFDDQGNLVDGQHRLSAVKLSGLAQSFYVHRNVPASASRVMDQGLARTAAQIAALEMDTDVSVSRLTSAARACLEHGLGVTKPSNQQIVDFATANASVLERYVNLGRQYTAGTHAAFAFAELQGWKGVREAGHRLEELGWAGEDDPMRALARSLGNMGGREGAKAKATRFFTTLSVLQYVDRGEGVLQARKHETMPPRVRESVRPGANMANA